MRTHHLNAVGDADGKDEEGNEDRHGIDAETEEAEEAELPDDRKE